MSFDIQKMSYRDYRAMMKELRLTRGALTRIRRHEREGLSISIEDIGIVSDFSVKAGLPIVSMESDGSISMEAVNSMMVHQQFQSQPQVIAPFILYLY